MACKPVKPERVRKNTYMEKSEIHIGTCKAAFKPLETKMLDICGKFQIS